MEIILKEDIIGLGYKNDIVNVKNGYGRNYLIPQGKGVIASESAKKVLAENLKQQAHKLAVLKAEPTIIKTLETGYRRDEKVIRYITVKLDKYAAQYAEKRVNKFKKEEA